MKRNLALLFFPIIFLFLPTIIFAQKSASLFLTPSNETYLVGEIFNLTLAVKSEIQAINAAEATIKFDPTLIKVKSISKSGSIFSLWPEEPSFSNSAGEIKFVGGSPTPYKGSGGTIFTITFEAQKEGVATINFSQGRVLAADGLGTDITDKLIGGSYTIKKVAEIEEKAPPEVSLTPLAPKISSPTHPDPKIWYQNKNPKFVWTTPKDIIAVKIGLSKNPRALPTTVYEPPISSKEFENLEDGIWYFSVQFKNEQGWGAIGRFKVQIDTTPPKEFNVSVDNEGKPQNPFPLFKFKTTDDLSGIDYYEIILNGESFAKVKPEEIKEGVWKPTSPLEPKNYEVQVKAFDRAGNFALATTTFSVEPIPLEIFPFPKKIKVGNPLKVEGKTVSNVKVILNIQKGGEIISKETRSDEKGYFKFEEILAVGKYLLWIEIKEPEIGVGISTKYEVEVVKERIILYLTILLIILILIGLLIVFFLFARIKKEREKIKLERLKKLKEEKMKAYLILKKEIEEQIKYLKSKVDLSRSETRILESLERALREAEEERSKIESEEKK